jgi:PST family polysaccharide transporter
LSVRKKFISGFGWQSVNVLTQIVLQLVFIGVLARKLGTEDFGVMAIALAVVGFIEIFSQIGIGPALIQKKDLVDEHINGAFFISLILGIVFTLLLLLLAPAVANFYDHPPLKLILQVIGLSFIISAISIVPKSLIIKEMAFKKLFIGSFVAMSIGNLLIGITLAYLDFNIWAYVIALLSQNVILTVCYWLLRPVKVSWNWSWKSTKGMIRYGGGSTLFNMFNYAATKADTLIVGKYSSIDSALEGGDWNKTGIYDRSVWLMSLPITVLGKLSDSVMFSGLSMLQDQNEKLQRAYLSGSYLISMIVFPACVFMIFFTEQIVLLFLGDQYLTAVPIVRILFVGVAIRSLIKLSDAVVRALDVVYTASLIKAFFLALVCLGTFIGLSGSGNLERVAVAIVIAIFIQYALITTLSLRKIKLGYGKVLKRMIPPSIIAVIVLLVSWGCTAFMLGKDLGFMAELILAIISNGVVIIVVALAMPWVFGKGDDNILKLISSKLPNSGTLGQLKRMLNR